ncbi:FxSxx-COOH system tetratricopeptide repeat protein [Nocardia anaemiae]|uniref:FxSxx-COOH system tetratricopeptide repeat protein n=1 Tax=Nocardia anaemiae TaxID=263910 RepID=UPI000A015C96|nr:FxSxx-COOH system tetratricopeptide repeat protein [Nocardia anaemiae]
MSARPASPREEYLAQWRALYAAAGKPSPTAIASEIGGMVSISTVAGWFDSDDAAVVIPRDAGKFEKVLRVLYAKSGKTPAARIPDKRTITYWQTLRGNAQRKPPRSRPGPDSPDAGCVVVGRIPRRAPYFVVRAQVEELRETLQRASVAVVVTGMRGAGKTQVAAAYAREAVGAGEGVVGWVNAETADTLLAGLADIATRVGVAGPDGDSAVSARRLRDHLSGRQDPALLVLDNATDPDLVDRFLPTGGVTRVVVTTIDRSFTQLGEIIDAGEGFARDESITYLRESTGLNDDIGAAQVAKDLGDLPLALSAAAATITGRRLDYSRYRQLLAAQPLPAVLPRRRGSDHPLAVDQALLLSIQTTETPTGAPELDEKVRWLLGVMAMLAPDGVDYTMLPDSDCHLAAALQRCVEGSLLSWSTTGNTIVMHRLLGRVLRQRAQTTHTITSIAADAVVILAPQLFDEAQAFQRREEGSRLVDHIEALWEAINHIPDLDTLAIVLAMRRWATHQLIESSDLTRAIDLARRTVVEHEQFLGSDHPDALTARHTLAYAYHWAERLPEAITLHEQVFIDRERVLGPDHPDTLTARHNVANTYESAGRLSEAIDLYERNLTDRERVLGLDHPDTLHSRNNLANTYRSAGRLSEAIDLYERNLADRERVLGPDHPDTLTSRHNVANAYRSARRLTEAIELHEQVLSDRERILGAEHPYTLYSRNSLAGTYRSAGRLSEAIDLYERNLADRERVLGPDHPDTLTSRHNVANVYWSAGRLAEAIELHERVLSDRERILAPGHPDTLTTRHNLALAYRDVGRVAEAIPLFERNLADRER